MSTERRVGTVRDPPMGNHSRNHCRRGSLRRRPLHSPPPPPPRRHAYPLLSWPDWPGEKPKVSFRERNTVSSPSGHKNTKKNRLIVAGSGPSRALLSLRRLRLRRRHPSMGPATGRLPSLGVMGRAFRIHTPVRAEGSSIEPPRGLGQASCGKYPRTSHAPWLHVVTSSSWYCFGAGKERWGTASLERC